MKVHGDFPFRLIPLPVARVTVRFRVRVRVRVRVRIRRNGIRQNGVEPFLGDLTPNPY